METRTKSARFAQGRERVPVITRSFAYLFSDRRVGGVWLLLLGGAGTLYYAVRLNAVYPIRTWLFCQLGELWGWLFLFSLACASFGQFLLHRVLRVGAMTTLESAVMGMACGVLAFVWGMYIGGALAWYGPFFAIALPMLMLVVSHREGLEFARVVLHEYRLPAVRRVPAVVATLFGVVCLGVIYLGIMTPDTLNYDSAWCHMTVAQDYAREHRIVAFPGDYNKNVPQLHSLIYAWGFMLPGLSPPLRWMMALHSEFALFAWTLAGTGAGISSLLGGKTLRGSWATFFLFPVIFVYDSNLGGAADHVCAFFAAPMLIALLRFCRSFRAPDAALLAATSAGALLTKYQALYLVAPAAGIILVHAIWHGVRTLSVGHGSRPPLVTGRQIVTGLGVLIGLGVLLVSPHFVRNLIFYRNPVYPYLSHIFTGSSPQVPNGAYYIEYILKDFAYRPQGTLLVRLKHAVGLWFTFSFEPHYSYSHDFPTFGALFTLLLPLLPFVRHRASIALAAAVGGSAVFIWAFTYNVDRNLQVFMPVLVCVTGALLIEGFRLGWAARLGLLPLVGLQVVWGADALFYSGSARIASSVALIQSGFEGRSKTRLEGYRADFRALSDALPTTAKVLLHETHVNLGIDRPLVLDWQGFQGLISYDPIRTPRELFDRYRELGITHLIQIPHQWPTASKQEEVLWQVFVEVYAKHLGRHGGYELLAMPDKAPPREAPYRLAAFGLKGYTDGLYPIEGMNANQHLYEQLQKFPSSKQPLSAAASDLSETLAGVDAVFVGPDVDLEAKSKALLSDQFRQLTNYDSKFTLYVNRHHTDSR